MDTNESPQPSGWLSGRTRLVTIASVVAVGVAAAVGIGVNLGILGSASDGPVGNAAVADLLTPASRVVDTGRAGWTSAGAPSGVSTHVQEFGVDVAGTVVVARRGDDLHLESVAPSSGWTWSLAQSDPSSMQVSMTNGTRIFEFHASSAPDGSIAGNVKEPVPAAGPAPTVSRNDDHGDDHADDQNDHDKNDQDKNDHDTKDHEKKGHDEDD